MTEMDSGTVRFGATPVAEGGTPVETWTAWDHTFASLDLKDCPGLTVIAPHPDDETMGLGATIATLAASGVDVQVVSVSDGGASYPLLSNGARLELEAVRRAELRRSLGCLGAGEPITLGMPDGALSQYEQLMAGRIAALLRDFPAGRWCAATWRGDGHPTTRRWGVPPPQQRPRPTPCSSSTRSGCGIGPCPAIRRCRGTVLAASS